MGTTKAELQMRRGGGALSSLLRGEGVEHSPDVDRVIALPRREEVTEELIDLLSAHLLRPGGVGRLRPGQASALRELYQCGGLFAPMPCGSGKTLVTLLAATLLGSQRPVLLVPASLREKTRREFATYRANWRVRLPKIVSYQELGQIKNEDRLARLAPDLLMADEAHMIRRLSAGVTRRVRRYIEANPATVFAPLSGTLITDSIMDYHHLSTDALGDKAPVPMRPVDAERWARALDRDVSTGKRLGLGALDTIPGGFHQHMRETAGVVHVAGSDCPAALEISTWRPKIPTALERTIQSVQEANMRPDGELLNEWEAPTCLSQLALGFYYVWDPLPPEWWILPRRAWWAYARAVLDDQLPGFDTEGQIVQALDAGGPPPPYAEDGRARLAAWRAVKDDFEPNTVPVWLDRSIIQQAADHIDPTGWLVWTRFRAAGEELARIGVPYYGGGTNPEPLAGQSCAVSIDAHATGKNLQAWHASLILTPSPRSNPNEQLISRTHRAGQAADVVTVEYIHAIEYHERSIDRAVAQARAIGKASGFPQKLVDATWV
jgi:hypothetical protein